LFFIVLCSILIIFNYLQKSLFFFLQVISCDSNVCTLQVTDTAGSHQFPAMQRLSISRGHAFLLIYSICSYSSLEELKPIWQSIKEIKGPEVMPSVPIMVVGNKCDDAHREVR
jgi:DIRAS family, GTP-binding Ras-like 2